MGEENNNIIWCPYSNKEIKKINSSQEHIIALSLGGINGFEIPISRDIENLSSTIDGNLANSFFGKLWRSDKNILGHSKKFPIVEIKKSYIIETGQHVQSHFGKNAPSVLFDPRTKQYLQPKTPTSVKCEFKINDPVKIMSQFMIKTFLSSGYFIYGNLFRNYVDHDIVRNFLHGEGKEGLKGHIRLFEDKDKISEEPILLTQTLNTLKFSCVGFKLYKNNRIVFFCGILGNYIGMFHVEAETDRFPLMTEDDDGSRIIFLDRPEGEKHSGTIRTHSITQIYKMFLKK